MLAGDDLERLLDSVVSIYAGKGWAEAPPAADPPLCPQSNRLPMVDERWEETIAAVVRALERIATVTEARTSLPPPPSSALRGALGGADLLMRSEILAGRGAHLLALLPSFAYLTTFPFLGYAEALQGSERVRDLLESEGLLSA